MLHALNNIFELASKQQNDNKNQDTTTSKRFPGDDVMLNLFALFLIVTDSVWRGTTVGNGASIGGGGGDWYWRRLLNARRSRQAACTKYLRAISSIVARTESTAFLLLF
jgi:hypothetical protein